MIGLDTNVLVRFLTQDEPTQAEQANEVIAQTTKHGESLYINLVTLCETIWVLERAYKLKKSEIINILHLLLQTKELVFEEHGIIWRAIHDYKSCISAGFVDCLIGRQNEAKECKFTYTFDLYASKELSTFQILNK